MHGTSFGNVDGSLWHAAWNCSEMFVTEISLTPRKLLCPIAENIPGRRLLQLFTKYLPALFPRNIFWTSCNEIINLLQCEIHRDIFKMNRTVECRIWIDYPSDLHAMFNLTKFTLELYISTEEKVDPTADVFTIYSRNLPLSHSLTVQTQFLFPP